MHLPQTDVRVGFLFLFFVLVSLAMASQLPLLPTKTLNHRKVNNILNLIRFTQYLFAISIISHCVT